MQLSGLLQGDLKLFLTRVHHDGHSWSASCGQWFVAKHAAILPRQPTHSVWVNDITFLDVSSVLVCQAIRWSNLLSLMISHELQGGSLWPLWRLLQLELHELLLLLLHPFFHLAEKRCRNGTRSRSQSPTPWGRTQQQKPSEG